MAQDKKVQSTILREVTGDDIVDFLWMSEYSRLPKCVVLWPGIRLHPQQWLRSAYRDPTSTQTAFGDPWLVPTGPSFVEGLSTVLVRKTQSLLTTGPR